MTTHATIICNDETLSFNAALNLGEELARRSFSKTAYLILEKVIAATTAGLARLTAMRAALLAEGRDMRIIGLRGQARALYDIYHMNRLLPEEHPDARLLGCSRENSFGYRPAA